MKKKLVSILAVGLLAAGAVGCTSSNNGGTGGGGTVTIPTIDMAVGDFNAQQLYIFMDVAHLFDPNTGTANDLINPDVTLDDADFNDVNDIHFVGGDLYVADAGADEVFVWRNYLTLADSAAPDARLKNTTGLINHPNRIAIVNDVLAVANRDVPSVGLFAGASTLTGNDTTAPDVALTTGVLAPVDVYLVSSDTGTNETLYVGNSGATAAGQSVVSVYNDVEGIIAGGVNVPPDITLNQDTSFLSLGEGAHRVLVSNNILYASAGFADFGGVFVFNGADSLADDQLPDAVLGGIFSPNSLLVFGPNDAANGITGNTNMLWVGMGNGENACNSGEVSAQAFPFADSLINGQPPTVMLGDNTGIFHTQRIVSAGGVLIIDGYSNCDFDEGHLNIYFDGAHVATGQTPDISMNGADSSAYTPGVDPFSSTQGLAAVVRDLGT